MSRVDQLSALFELQVNGVPTRVHGSIGHAALMGVELPPMRKFNGTARDIDIWAPGNTSEDIEAALDNMEVNEPSPIDSGLSGLLIMDGNDAWVHKNGVQVALRSSCVFDEEIIYRIKDNEDIRVRSFSPIGLLAVHQLEPCHVRVGHLVADRHLIKWFQEQEVTLPANLQASIDEFHRAYKERYPLGALYHNASSAYAQLLPEAFRRRFRQRTHHFMLKHAGRLSPYAQKDNKRD